MCRSQNDPRHNFLDAWGLIDLCPKYKSSLTLGCWAIGNFSGNPYSEILILVLSFMHDNLWSCKYAKFLICKYRESGNLCFSDFLNPEIFRVTREALEGEEILYKCCPINTILGNLLRIYRRSPPFIKWCMDSQGYP